MAFPGPLPAPAEGGSEGEGQQVEDEFTCAGALRGSLLSLQPSVERIFGVGLEVGRDGDVEIPQDGQIWLQLRGRRMEVESAKLFVKGVVNQEEQQEVPYPEALHCVFCGAKGLFMDCLIKNTSAHIVVGSPGFLLISGLAEPVVRAYSLIIDLVQKYEGTQGRGGEAGLGVAGESLDSRRAFKSLVERWEDRHTLDLLVLPAAAKEVLLNLVRESRLDRERGPLPRYTEATGLQQTHRDIGLMLRDSSQHDTGEIPERSIVRHQPSSTFQTVLPDSQLQRPFASPLSQGDRTGGEVGREVSPDPFFRCFISDRGPQGQVEGAEGALGTAEGRELRGGAPQEAGEEEVLLSVGSHKEFEHLLKFFTAMGYTEEVVRRVLARTGPREVSQLLDVVQQEQDKEGAWESPSGGAQNQATAGGMQGEKGGLMGEGPGPPKEGEDFVLGVLKRAAASCGYTEDRVTEVYSNLPELNPHQLILELQRESTREAEREKGRGRSGAREGQGMTEEPLPKMQKEKQGAREEEEKKEKSRGKESNPSTAAKEVEARESGPSGRRDEGRGGIRSDQTAVSIVAEHAAVDLNNVNQVYPGPTQVRPSHRARLPPVRGPPQPTYPPRLYPNLPIPEPSSIERRPQRPHPIAAGSVVTGAQRFLEGLQAPFDLKLTDDPGDPGLRQVIIDGSNVAMSHGLGQFFSCRGIALAVQHFWNRGHRKITTFLPQWRQKRDPKVKEQHYLTVLQDLGLLSFTPSREVLGKRINSYDDRFMLQLAQKTDGVIVTNDNFRDLFDESPVWSDIIKKSLLQYAFVGDHFMPPDDPLGRGGPHLDDFLCSQNRPRLVGSHTFAGVPSSFPPPASPRAQTEVLHQHDWAPGGPVGPGRGMARGGRGGQDERSVAETSRLRQSLAQVFPGQESVVTLALQCNPTLTNVNSLSHFILERMEHGSVERDGGRE